MCKNNRSAYHCTNHKCKNHDNPEPKFFIKKGYYTTKHNSKKVPMYQCKLCGKKFSSHSFLDTKHQHKPELNKLIFNLYASNSSQNRLARNLNCNRKTVVRKVRWLAAKARQIHEAKLNAGEIQAYEAQFDEMETFEHSRMKPLSISLAVEVMGFTDKETGTRQYRSGKIIGIKVAKMPCKGHLAALSREKYGEREDTRREAGLIVLEKLKKAAIDGEIHIGTDGKTSYPKMFAEVLPNATISIITRKNCKGSTYDRMFSLNHTCARIRHDLSRMARKSWVTTKTASGLQNHLDLFVAYFNEYAVC